MKIRGRDKNRLGKLAKVALMVTMVVSTGYLVMRNKSGSEISVPEFKKSISDNGVRSILFKSFYLSTIKGASRISQYSQFLEKVVLSFKKNRDGMKGEDLQKVETVVNLMREYARGEESFWPRFAYANKIQAEEIDNSGLTTVHNANGLQSEFWSRARRDINQHKSSASLLLGQKNDGNILDFRTSSAKQRFMMDLASAKLDSKLTTGDLLFTQIMENSLSHNNHLGLWGTIKGWFTSDKKEPVKTQEEVKEEEKKKKKKEIEEKKVPPMKIKGKLEDKDAEAPANHSSSLTSNTHVGSTKQVLGYSRLFFDCHSMQECSLAWQGYGQRYWNIR